MKKSKYIEDAFAELEKEVGAMESEMDSMAQEFLSEFSISSNELENISTNYEKSNASNSIFDKAFNSFVGTFLVTLATKILGSVDVAVSDFKSKGIQPIGDERKLVSDMIGYNDGKIVKNGYLWRLGKMDILKQKFHDYILKSVASTQKVNRFLKDAKPIFVSTEKRRSDFASYYARYAYDSVVQATNSISLRIADARGLDRFEYEGDLSRDSRLFCVEHAGGIYTRADAKKFNEMNWRGKIQGVDFLIAVGGYNCVHVINWLPNE
jgi:hypothetical protein